VTTQPRFRFRLGILLLAVAWSVIVVWLNVTPLQINTTPFKIFEAYDFQRYGWPFVYLGRPDVRGQHPAKADVWDSQALAKDAIVGIVLVVVVTRASADLLRCVKHVFHRVQQSTSDRNPP